MALAGVLTIVSAALRVDVRDSDQARVSDVSKLRAHTLFAGSTDLLS